jgi:hypothetical protein
MADSTGTNLVSTALPLNFNVSGFYNGTKFIVSNAPIVSAVVPGMSNTTMTTLGQSIAAGSTVKVTGWSVSPTYLQNVTFNGSDATINTTGWYTISATILWNTTASFGQGIRVMNSAGSVGYVQATYAAGSNTSYWYNSVSTTVYLTSGGTLAIWADNQAGTAKTIAPFAAGQVFSILKVA